MAEPIERVGGAGGACSTTSTDTWNYFSAMTSAVSGAKSPTLASCSTTTTSRSSSRHDHPFRRPILHRVEDAVPRSWVILVIGPSGNGGQRLSTAR